MADEQPQTSAADAQPAPVTVAPPQPASAEATDKPVTEAEPATSGETVIKSGNNEGTSDAKEPEQQTAGEQATETTAAAGEADTTVVAEAPPAAQAVSTPVSNKKGNKGSTASANKRLQKKKSMPSLQLDCQPGQHFWARLKGHPPWPAIICDQGMLPEVLLASRPVSTARPDGSLRDDFKDDGKNAKDRTYPIMFLQTNEFAWIVNTALAPLDPEECKSPPKGKMTKSLAAAYDLASENHSLEHYKQVLNKFWEEEREREQLIHQANLEAAEAAEAAKAVEAEEGAKKKKKPRKSKAGDEDVDMEDADAPKSSKKRKKGDESDGDGLKPKKTPKVTKLNGPKTPNGESASSKKPKKKVVAPRSDEQEDNRTEEEKLANREKTVLYLRHRLQKGFLARDEQPKEAEMATMADFFVQLENYTELEPSIIRHTKIHKVLKAIVKLSSIPREEEFNFKKRSAAMLEIWNKRMEADAGATPAAEAKPDAPTTEAVKSETNGETPAAESAPAANGSTDVEAKAEDAADKVEEKVEEVPKPTEPAPLATDAPPAPEVKDTDGDIAMDNAPAPAPAPAAEAEAA